MLLNPTRLKMKHFQKKIRVLLVLLIFPFIQSSAQYSNFDYNGYAKYLFSSTKFPGINDQLYDHLLHLRLNTKYYATQSLTAAMELRFRTFYGESAYKIRITSYNVCYTKLLRSFFSNKFRLSTILNIFICLHSFLSNF